MWTAIINAAAQFSNTKQGQQLHELAKMTSPLQLFFGKEISDSLLHDLPFGILQSYGQATGGGGGGAGNAMGLFKAFGL